MESIEAVFGDYALIIIQSTNCVSIELSKVGEFLNALRKGYSCSFDGNRDFINTLDVSDAAYKITQCDYDDSCDIINIPVASVPAFIATVEAEARKRGILLTTQPEPSEANSSVLTGHSDADLTGTERSLLVSLLDNLIRTLYREDADFTEAIKFAENLQNKLKPEK